MKKRDLHTMLQYELLILPAFLLYIVFCGFPFFHTFFYSITNYNKYHIQDYHIVGLVNYANVFKMSMLKLALQNSVKYALLMTFFQSLLAIPLAVLLNRKVKMRNIYRTGFFCLPCLAHWLWVIYGIYLWRRQKKGLSISF